MQLPTFGQTFFQRVTSACDVFKIVTLNQNRKQK